MDQHDEWAKGQKKPVTAGREDDLNTQDGTSSKAELSDKIRLISGYPFRLSKHKACDRVL